MIDSIMVCADWQALFYLLHHVPAQPLCQPALFDLPIVSAPEYDMKLFKHYFHVRHFLAYVLRVPASV